jgi:geranylgeranyl pyrophosphate synthase
VLEACAKYLFEMDGGKKIRPTMVLLVARATAAHEEREGHGGGTGDEHGIVPLPSQKRLAEITEMIHTASLFHDDVIDEADSRRGVPSINKLYGNKMAILAGDFLLARASVSLARLRNVEVVELLSTVIEHLVKGEVMQSRPQALLDGGESGEAALQYYLHKNYYKTGSLMANSCRAAVLLAGHDERLQEQAFAYGRHVGLAFQLVDDVLDFEQSSETLGKPALNDLRQGLATAPVLLAANQFPQEIWGLVKRKFRSEGDVERVSCV